MLNRVDSRKIDFYPIDALALVRLRSDFSHFCYKKMHRGGERQKIEESCEAPSRKFWRT